MRLPSLRQVVTDALATLRRFPFVLLVAAVGTCAALVLADHEGPAEPTVLFNVLLACILGIPLLTALALVAEKRRRGATTALALQVVGVILLVGYAVTIPTDLAHAPTVTIFRFFILAAALVMFTAVAPFASAGEQNGFWQYNKTLLLRLLTGLVYSFVLFVGLLIALIALDQLFGIHVPEKRYLQLFIAIGGLFTTWFFLAGIPRELSQLETQTDYPKGLKVFAQYILLPLVLVYLVILYAYLAKILIAWDWPKGWVSAVILGYSGAGIFAFLLLHPLASQTENSWIGRAGRWFYILLVPTVFMLFLAIWRRVSEYGITESRYIVFAFGVWLVFLIFYFLFSKAKSIKIVPASLCVSALLLSFGPWGIFSVSERSQIGRLEGILSRTGILAEGTVRTAHGEVSMKDAKQISAILSYLHDAHGLGGIQSWFKESLKADTLPSSVAFKLPSEVAKMMGVEYVARWAESSEGVTTLEPETAYDVTGYDRMVRLQSFSRGIARVELSGDGLAYGVTDGCQAITFTDIPTGVEVVRIDLKRHVEGLLKEHGLSASGRIPNAKMKMSAVGNGTTVCVCPWDILVQQHDGDTRILRLNATVLYSKAKPSGE